MSRRTASFSQLLHYVNKGRVEEDEYYFKHNIYGNKPYNIVREYITNHKLLKKRKNGVALYHEVISLKYQTGYNKEELRGILLDIVEQYSQVRAQNCLVYAVVHEQHNQIHSHLMISANEIENHRPHYFSKAKFEEIKKQLEDYAYTKYPKLEKPEPKKKKARAKSKSIDREIHLKKRTGKLSEREKFKEQLNKIFSESLNPDEFLKSLEDENISIYKRGNTFGFLDTLSGRKYRLKTLELDAEFSNMNDLFTQQKKAKQEETKQQEKAPEKSQAFPNEQEKQKTKTQTETKSKENSKTLEREEFRKRMEQARKSSEKSNEHTK